MDRGYSPPGCRNRRFKDGGREAMLIVLILGFPRMMVGSRPNSSDSCLLRLARTMSSSEIYVFFSTCYTTGAHIFSRLVPAPNFQFKTTLQTAQNLKTTTVRYGKCNKCVRITKETGPNFADIQHRPRLCSGLFRSTAFDPLRYGGFHFVWSTLLYDD